MNDLVEKALHGLDVARREVEARPVPALCLAGFAAGSVVVVAGGRIGASPAAVPLDRWFGLLPSADYRIYGVGMGAVMLGAIGALAALWVLTLWLATQRGLSTRSVAVLGGCWAAPFAVGPPLLSTDIYRYVAQGMLSRRGDDPYHTPPIHLGTMRLVDTIDPAWRGTTSTDGPLTVLVNHLAVAVSGGSVLTAVIVLRLIAVASVVAIGRITYELADTRRAPALVLTVLNPAVLLYIVSAGHLTGVIVAFLLGSLLLARRRRWTRAVVAACLAAGMKPMLLVAVLPVLLVHVYGVARPLRWRTAARDVAAALVTLALCTFVVPDGWGWTRNLNAAARAHVAVAPASLVSDVMSWIVRAASYDDLAVGGRIAAAAAGLTAVAYLYLTVRTRPLDRTIGYALLAAAVLSPIVYPTYLIWPVLCLAPAAEGARRDWVVALSVVAAVLTPAGLGDRGADYATTICFAVVAAALAGRWYVQRRRAAALERAALSAA